MEACVDCVTPEVVTTFLSIWIIAGSISVISTTHTFTSSCASEAAIAFVFTFICYWAVHIMNRVVILATMFFTSIGMDTERCCRIATGSAIGDAFSLCWTPFGGERTAVLFTDTSVWAPGETAWDIAAVFFALVSVVTVFLSWWAAVVRIRDTVSIAVFFSPRAA